MKRVLIVDDAIDLGRLLQDALKTVYPDLPITVVPSAEEAVLESTRFTIDLLVTDVRLPGMSGLELIRKIRVRQPNVKVILMTGLAPEDRLLKQKDEVAPDIFIRKPIIPGVFLDAVEQLIGEKSAAGQTANPEAPAVEAPLGVEEKDEVLRELAAVMPGEPVKTPTRPLGARKGTGVLGMAPAEPQISPEEAGLSGVLSRLRNSVNALSTMLLDERGRPVAKAGDLPVATLETELSTPMMASLSASAKISYLLGQVSTQLVQAYRGVDLDLVIAPVGQYVLLIALRPGRTVLRLALAFEEALNAQAELLVILEGMGLHVQSPVEVGAPEMVLAEMAGMAQEAPEAVMPPEILETPLGQDPGLEKFEELFTRKKTGELKMQDPDTFWDMAATGEVKKEETQPGMLSFEQAQKLGLLPDDQES